MEKLQDKLLKMFGRELDYSEFLELVGSNVDGGGKIQVHTHTHSLTHSLTHSQTHTQTHTYRT